MRFGWKFPSRLEFRHGEDIPPYAVACVDALADDVRGEIPVFAREEGIEFDPIELDQKGIDLVVETESSGCSQDDL